jgi:hypothetical protein
MPRGCPVATLEERFVRKTIPQGDCWRWTGNKYLNEYGQLKSNVWGTGFAHQWACHHWNNTPLPIPKGMCIKHACDNRWCVNPAHLSMGTVQENIKEMEERNPNAMGRVTPSEDELEMLRQMIIDEVPRREMARRINHSRHWIDRIVRDYF